MSLKIEKTLRGIDRLQKASGKAFSDTQVSLFDMLLIINSLAEENSEPEPRSNDQIFIDHIQAHLNPGEEVVCKICGKTAKKIIVESKPTEEVEVGDIVINEEAKEWGWGLVTELEVNDKFWVRYQGGIVGKTHKSVLKLIRKRPKI